LNGVDPYQDDGQAARIGVVPFVNDGQEQGHPINGYQEAQTFRTVTEQETNQETYHGTHPRPASTHTQNGTETFHWDEDRLPIDHQTYEAQPHMQENNYNAGIGTIFPEDDNIPQQDVEDADLEDVDVEMRRTQRAEPSPELSFLQPYDYSSTGTHDEHGVAKESSIPGAGSSRTSQSSADISVDGGRFACAEDNCNKTYKTKSGLG
jgi:hypothetical protein